MRSRIRLFLLVGLLATIVDIGIVVSFGAGRVALIDTVALLAAAIVAYTLNRLLTFRGDPTARWVRRPILFASTAVAAGAVDLAILLSLGALGVPLLPAKIAAVLTAAILRWAAYRLILFAQVRRDLAERVDRDPAPGELEASIVIPAYNEAPHIEHTIASIVDALTARMDRSDFEIIVVDDGSEDDTAARALAAGARIIAREANGGKGAAVRDGVLNAGGRSVVFTDADLAYSPQLVCDVLDRIGDGWDVVVGSRRHDDANTLVRARRVRELGGRVINLLTQLVLLGHFHDTQCGLKGFRGDIGKAIFERTKIDGFAFDVEIFSDGRARSGFPHRSPGLGHESGGIVGADRRRHGRAPGGSVQNSALGR